MESLFGDVSALLQHSPWLAIVAVFLGGVTTALNPCVLAMIPLSTGRRRRSKANHDRKALACLFVFFVLGLAITFTVLGLISAHGTDVRECRAVLEICGGGSLFLHGIAAARHPQIEYPCSDRDPGEKAGLYRRLPVGDLAVRHCFDARVCPHSSRAPGFRGEKGNVLYGGFLLFATPSGTRHSSLLRGRPSALPKGSSNRKACARPTVSCRSSPAS